MKQLSAPDDKLGEGFLQISKTLLEKSPADPQFSQVALRRCMSSLYYALFHTLARLCANALIGEDKENRSNKAWVEIYRGLDHQKVYEACQTAKEISFPEDIKNFSEIFVLLQKERHRSDYDPTENFSEAVCKKHIQTAEETIKAVDSLKNTDKAAFATWVLITNRGAREARKKTKVTRA